MITDLRSMMTHFNAMQANGGGPLVRTAGGGYRPRKSVLMNAIIKTMSGATRVVEGRNEDGSYNRVFDVQTEQNLKRLASRAGMMTAGVSSIATTAAAFRNKLYSDKFMYRTMPGIQAMQDSIGGDPQYSQIISNFAAFRAEQYQEWGDIGTNVGDAGGYFLGQFLGNILGTALFTGATAASFGTASVPAAAAATAVKVLISELTGRITAAIISPLARTRAQRLASGHIEKLANINLGKSILEITPRLMELHNESKYGLMQNGMYKQGTTSNFVGDLYNMTAGKFGTGISLATLGVSVDHMSAMVGKYNGSSRSDGQIERKINFMEGIGRNFDTDISNNYFQLLNTSSSGSTKAIRETENALLKLAMAISGDGKITTASLKLSSYLVDFVADYRKKNTGADLSELTNVVAAVQSKVMSSGMAGSKDNAQGSMTKSTQIVDIISSMAKNVVDGGPLARQIALRGGVSMSDAARGAAGSEDIFEGMSAGLANTFSMKDVTVKDGTVGYKTRLGKGNYEHAYMTLIAPLEKGGAGLSPEQANLMIQYMVTYGKGGLDFARAQKFGQQGKDQISDEDKARMSVGWTKLATTQAKVANSFLKTAAKFTNEYTELSGMAVAAFRTNLGLLAYTLDRGMESMTRLMQRQMNGVFDDPLTGGSGSGGSGTYAVTGTVSAGYTSKTVDTSNTAVKSMMAQGLLTPRDISAVERLAAKYNADPNWFLAVFMVESSMKRNAVSDTGHTGYAQLSPDFMRKHGITSAQLQRMSLEEQAVYIDQYFQWSNAQAVKDGIGSLAELYLLIAAPAFADNTSGSGAVVYQRGRSAFETEVLRRNPLWDANRDGKVTTAELSTYVANNPHAKPFLTGVAPVRSEGPVFTPPTTASGQRVIVNSRRAKTYRVLAMSGQTSNLGMAAYQAMEEGRRTGVIGKGTRAGAVSGRSSTTTDAQGDLILWYGLCAAVAKRAYLAAGYNRAKDGGSADEQRDAWISQGFTMTHEQVMAMGGYQIGDLLYDRDSGDKFGNHVAMVGPGGILIQSGFGIDTERNSAFINTDYSVFGGTSGYYVVRPSMDANQDGTLTDSERQKYIEGLRRVIASQQTVKKKNFNISKNLKGMLKDSGSDMELYLQDKNGAYITDMSKLKTMEKSLEKSLNLKDNQVVLQGKQINGKKVYYFEVEVDGEDLAKVAQRVTKALGG